MSYTIRTEQADEYTVYNYVSGDARPRELYEWFLEQRPRYASVPTAYVQTSDDPRTIRIWLT